MVQREEREEFSSHNQTIFDRMQQNARVSYCRRIQELRVRRANILYIDEKWFSTHSHRRCLKHLPWEDFEPVGCDKLKVRIVISRRHALRVMFIEAVGEPEQEHGFDGKIFWKELQRKEHYNEWLTGIISPMTITSMNNWSQASGEHSTLTTLLSQCPISAG